MRRLASIAVGTSVAATLASLSCSPPSDPPANPVDTDGDGLSDLDEVNLYGTSPVLADTDGDGWNDYVEVVTFAFDPAIDPYRFNPRVADVPVQTIDFTSPPVITIALTDAEGQTQTFETSRSDEMSVSDANSMTNSNSMTNALDTPMTVAQSTEVVPGSGSSSGGKDAGTDGGGGGGGPIETPVIASITTTVSTTTDPSTSFTAEIAFDETQTQENAETLEQAQSYEESREITASSANLTLTAVLENSGHLAYRVGNLVLTATAMNADAEAAPVGNLVIDTPYSTYDEFALAPGDRSGPVNFIRTNLTLDVAQAILANANAVDVELGTVELNNSAGIPFVFNESEIASKTATLVIDYGGKRPGENYLVATNLDPAHPGITTDKALEDILRIPFQSDKKTGLTQIRDVGSSMSGGGHWLVTHKREAFGESITVSDGGELAPYDFKSIDLQAGDTLTLTYIAK